jgi:hypothetical protein
METYALGSTAQAQAFVPTERSSTMPVQRAGQTAAFVWGFTAALYPRLISWVRFTDDAGLHWQIDIRFTWRSSPSGTGSPVLSSPGGVRGVIPDRGASVRAAAHPPMPIVVGPAAGALSTRAPADYDAAWAHGCPWWHWVG